MVGLMFPDVIDLTVLAPFTSLTHLTWEMLVTNLFSISPPGSCVLPHLEVLSYSGPSPILLDILQLQPYGHTSDLTVDQLT
jgi:hypothetical protein